MELASHKIAFVGVVQNRLSDLLRFDQFACQGVLLAVFRQSFVKTALQSSSALPPILHLRATYDGRGRRDNQI